jgi:hypothetical protein
MFVLAARDVPGGLEMHSTRSADPNEVGWFVDPRQGKDQYLASSAPEIGLINRQGVV